MLLRICQKILNNKRRSIWRQAGLYKWGPRFCHCWRTLYKQKIFFKILAKNCVPCSHVSTVKHIVMTSLLCVHPYQGLKSDHWLAPWMATSMCVGFNVLLDFPILTPGAYLACLPSMGWGTWQIPGVPAWSRLENLTNTWRADLKPPTFSPQAQSVHPEFLSSASGLQECRWQTSWVLPFLAKIDWKNYNWNPNKRQISFCDLS